LRDRRGAKGQDERESIADAVPAAGHDRQSTRKAHAEHADAPVRRQLPLSGRPVDRVFDDIGDRRRDAEALQVRRRDRDDGKPGGDQILRQADQACFVDPVAMDAGHQDDGPADAAARQAASVAGAPGRSAARAMNAAASRYGRETAPASTAAPSTPAHTPRRNRVVTGRSYTVAPRIRQPS
jgi:hypothetical protein